VAAVLEMLLHIR